MTSYNPLLDQKVNRKPIHHIEIINEFDWDHLYEKYGEELLECDLIKEMVAALMNMLETKGASSIRSTWRTKNNMLIAIVEWKTYE